VKRLDEDLISFAEDLKQGISTICLESKFCYPVVGGLSLFFLHADKLPSGKH
jgi:hypothetical protein